MDQSSYADHEAVSSSLLLATSAAIGLLLARGNLSQHDHAISIHEGHAGETLAVLEAVANQRLLRLEAALGHLVRLQSMRLLHLLAACFLPHLPLERRDPAGSPAAAHEAD